MRSLSLGLALSLCLSLSAVAQVPQTGGGLNGATAAAAITVDATGSEQGDHTTSITSFDYTGLTVGTGNGLVCSITFGVAINTFPTSVTATWDNGGTNQAMTSLVSRDSTVFASAYIFGLKAPTAGNKTLHVAWTNVAEIFIACVSYNNVNQTTPFPNTQQGDAVQTITVTSATNHMVQAAIGNRNVITSPTGTTIYLDNVNGFNISAAANRDAGAASVIIGDASAAFPNQVIAATDIGN